jgi:L-alanine-DL-glutamate epimerase-like enolase superfamily enzyme
MDFELERVTYRFRQPIATAYGTLTDRDVLVLRLRDDDGNEGLGEAAPLEAYDGVTLQDAEAGIRAELADEPTTATSAAALDVASIDLRSRIEGRPIAELRSERPSGSIPVNATIAATDRAGAAREAAAAAEAGFETVKLKVGVGDDAGRVAAVRAAVGANVAIRIDANGAWDVAQAIAALRSLAPAGIELCEEPVHGVAALADLRERLDGELPIAMDETAREPDAIQSGACDFVCLKIAGCGGITPLWAAADAARAAGSEVYVASTYDGPVGIAAGLHAAAALGPDVPACGLATLPLFENVDDPFPARDGRIEVPRGPGLGITWPVG